MKRFIKITTMRQRDVYIRSLWSCRQRILDHILHSLLGFWTKYSPLFIVGIYLHLLAFLGSVVRWKCNLTWTTGSQHLTGNVEIVTRGCWLLFCPIFKSQVRLSISRDVDLESQEYSNHCSNWLIILLYWNLWMNSLLFCTLSHCNYV